MLSRCELGFLRTDHDQARRSRGEVPLEGLEPKQGGQNRDERGRGAPRHQTG